MSWLSTVLFGLLIGLVAAAYAGVVADAAVPWLRISTREGGAGYFVVLMILLGFVGGSILGMVLCRLTGGPGLAGVGRGAGIGLAVVLGFISILGGLAWLSREVAPLIDGRPLDVAVEIRLPEGAARPVVAAGAYTYVALYSGAQRSSRTGPLRVDEARLEDGHWIVPGTVPIHVSVGDRSIGVQLAGNVTYFFGTTIPASPTAAGGPWSDWQQSRSSVGTPEGPVFELRYRVVPRPPPPPAAVVESSAPAGPAPLPAADAPTEAWLAFTTVSTPPEIRALAVAGVRDRPDFVPLLEARIAGPDPDTARDAMYLVGEMRPPPAALGDAVRRRAAGIVAIAEAIDPAAEDSRTMLYDQVHTVATGVLAAAFGLRVAGVDLRPELRALAAVAEPREKEPAQLSASALRIIAYFDKLDREGRVLD